METEPGDWIFHIQRTLFLQKSEEISKILSWLATLARPDDHRFVRIIIISKLVRWKTFIFSELIVYIWKALQKKVRKCQLLHKKCGRAVQIDSGSMLCIKPWSINVYWGARRNPKCFEHLSVIFEAHGLGETALTVGNPYVSLVNLMVHCRKEIEFPEIISGHPYMYELSSSSRMVQWS